jgi:hypothetical protein
MGKNDPNLPDFERVLFSNWQFLLLNFSREPRM